MTDSAKKKVEKERQKSEENSDWTIDSLTFCVAFCGLVIYTYL